MNDLQFLSWVRGPGLDIALAVFLLGAVWRLIEIYTLGRAKDWAKPRHVACASGWHTVWRRFKVPPGLFERSPVTYVAGYVFHIGLFAVVLFFAPHIKLIQAVIGFSWPALPSQLIDLTAVVTLAALIVVLVDRIRQRVKRFLSTFEDWLTWAVTFLPVLTGYLAAKHLLLPYTEMLALHILSVEVLLVVLPFTKLFHAVTAFASRWYTGQINGRKGVPV
jgi:nitrate reductase gamma subunit